METVCQSATFKEKKGPSILRRKEKGTQNEDPKDVHVVLCGKTVRYVKGKNDTASQKKRGHLKGTRKNVAVPLIRPRGPSFPATKGKKSPAMPPAKKEENSALGRL